MKGYEVAYLWSRAKLLDDKALTVAARGEVFNPSDNFVETTDVPVSAHAVFHRNPDRLVLRLRHPRTAKVSEMLLDRIAATVYGGRRFTALPRVVFDDLDVIERAFYCEDLPWKPSPPSSP